MLPGTHAELGVIALMGVVLAGSLGSAFIRRIFQPNHIEGSLLEGTLLKVVLSVIVVVLGLSASILTPILPLLVLIGAVRLLPIGGGQSSDRFPDNWVPFNRFGGSLEHWGSTILRNSRPETPGLALPVTISCMLWPIVLIDFNEFF